MTTKNLSRNTFKFKGIDGNKYILSPLDLEDWGNYVYWIQFKPYNDADAAGVSKARLDSIYEQCIKRKKVIEEVEEGVLEEFDLNFSSTVVQESLSTQAATFYLLLVSLKKKHEDIESISEVFHIAADKNPELSIVAAYNKLLELSGLVDAVEPKDPTDPNTTNT